LLAPSPHSLHLPPFPTRRSSDLQKTLGLEYVPDALQGPLQAAPHHAVHAPRDRSPDRRHGRLVSDPELDPHAAICLVEPEAALLPDQARLRLPLDRLRAAPAVQAQDVLERHPERHHLDVVAGAHATAPGPDWLPAAHTLEDL